jgi:hypothetical protein
MPVVPFIPAIIAAGGAVASTAIAKKKSKQQKAMEQLQLDLTQKAARRDTQLQPVHDSILQAYSAMTSPQGSNIGASMNKALPGAPPNYYAAPQTAQWWGPKSGQNAPGPDPNTAVPRPPWA